MIYATLVHAFISLHYCNIALYGVSGQSLREVLIQLLQAVLHN